MASEMIGKDINGVADFSLPAPVMTWDAFLSANTVVSMTTPANFNRAFFSYAIGTNVWITLDGSSPVVPASPAFSKQELNPAIRQIVIQGGQTIKMISDTASYVNIRFDQGQAGATNV